MEKGWRKATVVLCAVVVAGGASAAAANERSAAGPVANAAAPHRGVPDRPALPFSLAAVPVPAFDRSAFASTSGPGSRTGFASLRATAALALTRSVHGDLLDEPAGVRPQLPAGHRITGYRDRHAATLTTPTGRAVVESALPLATPTAGGELAPVDLTLRPAGERFRSVRPLVASTLPERLEDGVSLDAAGVRLTPVAPDGSALGASGIESDGGVFFANSQTDTDTIAKPIPLGVETFSVLRSPASPETLGFRVRGPQGSDLVAVRGPAGVAAKVVGDDGVTIAEISAPNAFDAAGEAVPVETRVLGDRLHLSVPHRGSGWSYPITVDPALYDEHGQVDQGAWVFASPNPTTFQGSWGWTATTGNGFHDVDTNNRPYTTGEWGMWGYVTQGVSRIYALRTWTTVPNLQIDTDMQNVAAITSPAGTEALAYLPMGSYTNHDNLICVQAGCPPSAGSAGNGAMWQQVAIRPGNRFFTTLSNAQVFIAQDVGPTITPTATGASAGGWMTRGDSYRFAVNDPGMGVYQVAASSPGNAAWTGNLAGAPNQFGQCVGVQCDQSLTLNRSVGNLPDGLHTLSVSAWDAVWLGTTSNVQAKVDNAAPQITLGGALSRGEAGRFAEGRHTLQVSVRDGVAGTPSSGVSSISVAVDGAGLTPSVPVTRCQPGPCSASGEWQVDGSRYAEGTHRVVVTAYDDAGNSTTQRFSFNISRAATTEVGPATVNLHSGDARLTPTDVAVAGVGDSLSVGRTYRSMRLNGSATSPFGPGWELTLPGRAGGDWRALAPAGDSWVATSSSGEQAMFVYDSATARYEPSPGYAGYTLTARATSPPPGQSGSFMQMIVTSPAGDTSTFVRNLLTPAVPAVLTSTSGPGGVGRTTYVFETVGTIVRPTRVVASASAGVDCAASVVAGCRVLTLRYATATTATSTQLGRYANRLDQVDLTAYDPAARAMRTVAVGRWEYDNTGRLRSTWDPRMPSPLKAAYTYDARGRVATTARGSAPPWRFTYRDRSGDPYDGRLLTVSREDPTLAQTATWTMAYDVPLSGTGAPHPLGASDVARWGQAEAPQVATAVFPPDAVPGNPVADYERATIHYLDGQGREVNLALPGDRLSATSFDANGNVVATLTPGNRLRAAAATAGGQDPLRFATQLRYSADGSELTDTFAPVRSATLADGRSVTGRAHVGFTYDENAPGGGAYGLLTTERKGFRPDGETADADVRTTRFEYSGQSDLGWRLRAPTAIVSDPGGLGVRHTRLYDPATGQTTETRNPKGSAGGDAHTVQTVYYTVGANAAAAACGNRPEWAGTACMARPAAQPGTAGLPSLPVTTTTYDMWGAPVVLTDTADGRTRTTTMTYDDYGRPTRTAVVSDAGDPMPPVEYEYDPVTGLERLARTGSGASELTIRREFDALGRITRYVDADGEATEYGYDLLGRVTSSRDSRAAQTYRYDALTGYLVGLDDSEAGAFTAEYDDDGRLVAEEFPNHVRAVATFDPSGAATSVRYATTDDFDHDAGARCTSDCTWLVDAEELSAHGQVVNATGTLGSRNYEYDAIGRLAVARRTPVGEGCTTRTYGWDANTNRVSTRDVPPGWRGACGYVLPSTPETVHTYDSADRLTDDGTAYDAFGRITRLSAANAGGTTLESAFYADDTLRAVSQDGRAVAFDLDPSSRVRARTLSGTASGTEVVHYGGDGEAPSWTVDDQGHVTRLVASIGGGLAVELVDGRASYKLSDLHGNVVASADAGDEQPQLLPGTDEYGIPDWQTETIRYRWGGAALQPAETPSGVVAMGTRTYVPQIGRFLQPDPIRQGSANAYDYAGGDPVNRSDVAGAYVPGLPQWMVTNAAEIAAGAVIYAQEAEAAAQAAAAADEAEGTGSYSTRSAAAGAAAKRYKPCRDRSGSGWEICRTWTKMDTIWSKTSVMRWGSERWGYLHLRKHARAMGGLRNLLEGIEYMLTHWPTARYEGTTNVYTHRGVHGCGGVFKVVYQAKQTRGQERGVITAYCMRD